MSKSKFVECGSCGAVYVENHWLKALCPTCNMQAAVYLMEAAPRAKKSHFIKNILILAKMLSLDPEQQIGMTTPEIKEWAEENYVPYVMVAK